MKERPILFNTEMVIATLEGHKTQTRRVIKPQPEPLYGNGEWYPDRYNHTEDWCFWGKREYAVSNKCGLPLFKCPYGQIGDRLWVRETWDSDCTCGNPKCNGVIYKAGYEGKIQPEKWRPSIFMPRWASRITLEITDIRVQRVQEITDDDCKSEGTIERCSPFLMRSEYRGLWDSINAKRGYGWDKNCWVWVVSFKGII